MNVFHKALIAVAVVLTVVLGLEWRQVKAAEAGPAQLVHDIDQHAFGGVLRSDLEEYLSQRGGDVAFENVAEDGHSASVDHVSFRDIRHLGDRREDLKGEFYYDAGDHLVYYSLKRVWTNSKEATKR